MAKGWIKLDRSIMEHWVYDDYEMEHCWIDLLLLANHANKKVALHKSLVTIEKGQHMTSISKLARRWHMSRKSAKKILETFQNDGMISFKRYNNGILVTVLNYGVYQGQDEKKGKNGTTVVTTDVTTGVTTDVPTVVATGVTPEVTQTRMNKNDIKNDLKNEQEKGEPQFGNGGRIIE